MLAERAAAAIEPAGDGPDRLRAEATMVVASCRLGRRLDVVDRAIDAISLAERHSDVTISGILRIELAGCARAAGVPLVGAAVLRPVLTATGIRPAMRADALVQLTGCLTRTVDTAVLDGALAEADRLYDEDRQLDPDSRLVLRALLRSVASGEQRRRGDAMAAVDAAREGADLLGTLHRPTADNGQAGARVALRLVHGLLDLGRIDEAGTVAATQLRRPVRAPAADAIGWLSVAMAVRIHLATGTPAPAMALLREAAELGKRHRLSSLRAEALTILSDAHERVGQLAEALDCLRTAQGVRLRRARVVYSARTRLVSAFGETTSPEEFVGMLGVPAGRRSIAGREQAAELLSRVGMRHPLPTPVGAGHRAAPGADVTMVLVDVAAPGGTNTPGAINENVLSHVLDRLRAAAPSEAQVARVGGAELVVLLPGAPAAQAEQWVADLRSAMASVDWTSFTPGLTVAVRAAVAQQPGSHAAEPSEAAPQPVALQPVPAHATQNQPTRSSPFELPTVPISRPGRSRSERSGTESAAGQEVLARALEQWRHTKSAQPPVPAVQPADQPAAATQPPAPAQPLAPGAYQPQSGTQPPTSFVDEHSRTGSQPATQQPTPTAQPPASFAEQQSRFTTQPASSEQQPRSGVQQPASFAEDQSRFGAQQSASFAEQQSRSGVQQPTSFAEDQSRFGAQQPTSFAEQQSRSGAQQPASFAAEQPRFGAPQSTFFAEQQSTSGAQPAAGQSPPAAQPPLSAAQQSPPAAQSPMPSPQRPAPSFSPTQAPTPARHDAPQSGAQPHPTHGSPAEEDPAARFPLSADPSIRISAAEIAAASAPTKPEPIATEQQDTTEQRDTTGQPELSLWAPRLPPPEPAMAWPTAPDTAPTPVQSDTTAAGQEDPYRSPFVGSPFADPMGDPNEPSRPRHAVDTDEGRSVLSNLGIAAGGAGTGRRRAKEEAPHDQEPEPSQDTDDTPQPRTVSYDDIGFLEPLSPPPLPELPDMPSLRGTPTQREPATGDYRTESPGPAWAPEHRESPESALLSGETGSHAKPAQEATSQPDWNTESALARWARQSTDPAAPSRQQTGPRDQEAAEPPTPPESAQQPTEHEAASTTWETGFQAEPTSPTSTEWAPDRRTESTDPTPWDSEPRPGAAHRQGRFEAEPASPTDPAQRTADHRAEPADPPAWDGGFPVPRPSQGSGSHAEFADPSESVWRSGEDRAESAGPAAWESGSQREGGSHAELADPPEPSRQAGEGRAAGPGAWDSRWRGASGEGGFATEAAGSVEPSGWTGAADPVGRSGQGVPDSGSEPAEWAQPLFWATGSQSDRWASAGSSRDAEPAEPARAQETRQPEPEPTTAADWETPEPWGAPVRGSSDDAKPGSWEAESARWASGTEPASRYPVPLPAQQAPISDPPPVAVPAPAARAEVEDERTEPLREQESERKPEPRTGRRRRSVQLADLLTEALMAYQSAQDANDARNDPLGPDTSLPGPTSLPGAIGRDVASGDRPNQPGLGDSRSQWLTTRWDPSSDRP
jgi:hypothetical protein